MAMIEMDRELSAIREAPEPMRHPHGFARSSVPAPHLPPHLRQQMLRLQFEDRDFAVFQEVFGDEDTAVAAMDILCEAPPEIQILALQILHLIEKEEN